MRSNIFALTAGLAATTSAFDCSGHYFSFFNRPGNAMSYQRLDPALYPGTESPHLHSFDGANGLSSTTDFAETQSSSCTTARVKADKSLYWRPSLYFNDGKSFTRVPEKSTKIYYKSGDGDRWANVTGFPEDFNMIAGEPLKRSKGDNAAGVRWGCHQPDGGSTAIFDEGFPSGFSSCDYGFATEVTFPSCWNGEKLDPKNPNAHMAYPNGFAGVGIENCPTTHRAARFPTIFVEFWYDISSFKGKFGPNDKPWALSNGDPTGYGMHADFLNGWEKGVLEKATAETGGCNCGCGCGQTEMEQCFGKENVNSDSDPNWAQCDVTGIHAGEAEPALDKLPGCNPLQYGPAKATPVTGAGCNAAPAPTGSAKTSSAAYPEATPSSKHEEYPAMSIGIDMPAQAEKNEYSAMLPVTSSAAATPKESSVISFPTLIYSEGAYVMPSDVPSKDGECPVPVTVTYTPTVTVTATPVAAKVTPCDGQTYTATVTQTATVTVDAAEYGTY